MRKTHIYVMYIYPLRKHYAEALLGLHLISTSNWKIDIKDSGEICLDVHQKICSIQSQWFLSPFSSRRKPTIRPECSQPSHTSSSASSSPNLQDVKNTTTQSSYLMTTREPKRLFSRTTGRKFSIPTHKRKSRMHSSSYEDCNAPL